jgi:hypothetical protein
MQTDAHKIETEAVSGDPPLALFDATHGQAHWAQTGYPSREMHSNFDGLRQALCGLGCTYAATNEKPLSRYLAHARLLVLPPPAGRYHAHKACWRAHPTALFSPGEIQDLLAFLRAGGRLLAFAYRFGDSFTRSNLRDLFGPLGCLLHDDAVVDVTTLRTTPSLQTHFETPADLLPLGWFRAGVQRVCWRPSATFTVLPGASAQPLALSPGGRCLAFDRTQRCIRFDSLPIAVAGVHHHGRFALFGGPHLFETGPFGLLQSADNARFLANVLRWLLEQDDAAEDEALRRTLSQPFRGQLAVATGDGTDYTRVDGAGAGAATVAAVERRLRRSGVLKALSRAQWMP